MAAMAVYLDDVSVELPGESLGAVVMAANRRLAAEGRIVVEVEVDGDALGGDTLAQRQQEQVAGHELHLRSASPRELALTVLDGARTRLDDARRVQSDCAELLQRDQAPEALSRYNEAIAAWLQVQEALRNTSQLLQLSVEGLAVDDRSAAQMLQGLVRSLVEIKRMLKDGDTVGLADALAYEWPDITDRWDRLLGELMRRIEEQS